MRHVLFGQHRPRTLKRFFLGLFVAVIAVTSVLTPLNTYAKTESEMNLVERTQSYAYLNAVRKCIADSDGNLIDNSFAARRDRISVDDVRSGNWFQNNTGFDAVIGDPYRVAASYLNDNTDSDTDTDQGLALCNNVLKDALGLWGYSDGLEFMCDSIGFRANNSSCETGSGEFGQIHPYEDRFYQAVVDKVYGGNEPSLLETIGGQGRYPGRYLLYLSAFQQGCQAVESSNPAANFRYTDIQIVDESGDVEEVTYEGVNRGDRRNVYIGRDGLNVVQPTCAVIADEVNNYAADYRAYRLANPEEPTTGTGDTSFECQGANPPASCTDGSSPTCSIDGIGWILCPVIQFAADITDQLYNFLADSFLRVDVRLLSTQGESNGTYVAWTIMRNLANVAFVIVFLIIIFSQLTSLGVSNYGVKKMLPRLVIAAILVNISFFVCQVAVDLSNIAGYGLKSVFEGMSNGLVDPSTPLPSNGTASAEFQTWGGLAGAVIAVAAVGAGYAALGSLITVLAAALVSILVIFFILIVRQVLIVLLIVIAPLAFVAYLLPNTEPLFTKWRKLFVSLLMVFPVIGIVYGASSLASEILSVVYSNAEDGLNTVVGQIVAGGALVIPLIAVPFILKASLDGFGKLGSMINSVGNKASNAAGKAAGARFDSSRLGKFQKYRKRNKEIDRALTQSGAYAGRNPLRKALSGANKGINSKLGRFGGSLAADGVSLARESEEKAAKDQATLLRSQIASGAMTSEKLDEEAAKAFRTGDRVMTKAIQDVMFEQGGSGMNRYTEAVRKAQATGGMSAASFEAMRENINTKHGQLVKTKSAPLSKLAGVGGTLDGHADDIGTWAMSAGDLAGQTGAQLQYAADRKLINPAVARAMMKDARIKERLDPDQQAALTKASQETDASYSERVVEADTKKKKTAQDAAFATYEAAGNVETYRQAGEAKVEAAAQGSAGSTPFVVDSSGSVTSNTSSGRVRSIQVEAAEGVSGTGVFVVDRTGTTEAPAAPEPSVLDVNPDAAQTVADLNNPYRTMDQTNPAPIDPADVSGVFGGSATTSIDIPVTVMPEPRVAPNPFTSMEQPGLQNPVDPADISPLTGQSTTESIEIPLNNDEKK